VSVFAFDLNTPSGHQSAGDRRSLLALARNALRKLRTLRHPNVLKFLDGSESDSAVWIVTEPVRSLATALEGPGLSEESKVFGLLHLATALSFLNKDGFSIHGNIRTDSIWLTQGGEWKLGGMEICTRKDEDAGVIWVRGPSSTSRGGHRTDSLYLVKNMAGMLRDSRTLASPEVRKGGWTVLREQVVRSGMGVSQPPQHS
jgi:SCY1-like protein 1